MRMRMTEEMRKSFKEGEERALDYVKEHIEEVTDTWTIEAVGRYLKDHSRARNASKKWKYATRAAGAI